MLLGIGIHIPQAVSDQVTFYYVENISHLLKTSMSENGRKITDELISAQCLNMSTLNISRPRNDKNIMFQV